MRFFIILLIFSLSGCSLYNRYNLFFAACEDEADCKRFWKSYNDWRDDLKSRPNYEALVSDKGVDEDKNGLRDDLDLFIDKYMGINDKHWLFRHAWKQYASMLYYYSNFKPNYDNLKSFNKERNKVSNCQIIVEGAEGIYGNFGVFLNAKVRFVVLKTMNQRINMDMGFFKKGGQPDNYQFPHLQVLTPEMCGYSFEKIGEYKDKILTRGNAHGRKGMQIFLKRMEKKGITQYRNRYEEYFEKKYP